jgi:phosphoribosylaminoimidazole-succinocarboxamide synthase
MDDPLLELPLAFPPGKGKDMREIPGHPDLLLQVFRDSLSTHNVVHASEIPGKGELINAQTLFMAINVLRGVKTHLSVWGTDIYDILPSGKYPYGFHYRSVIVRRSDVTPIEFIWRDYLCGSLYNKHYKFGLDPYGLNLPAGLSLMHHFPETVFTPTDKSKTDDERISHEIEKLYPDETKFTGEVYHIGSEYLAARGITLIDFKAEAKGTTLVDDWLNGDCCRMARTESIVEGREPPFLDKEPFRKMAEQKWADRPRTPLEFSQDEILAGLRGYHEAFEAVAGMSLREFKREYLD